MEKEKKVPVVEVILIIIGVSVYYFSHQTDPFEVLGGLVAIAVGAVFVGYIPYFLLKNKIQNPKIKVFSVVFLLLNLLMFISTQPL